MTSSLREEIEEYHRKNFDDTPEWTATTILKMIEKRIDERIEWWQDEKRVWTAKKMFVRKTKIRGRIEAYKDIKELFKR